MGATEKSMVWWVIENTKSRLGSCRGHGLYMVRVDANPSTLPSVCRRYLSRCDGSAQKVIEGPLLLASASGRALLGRNDRLGEIDQPACDIERPLADFLSPTCRTAPITSPVSSRNRRSRGSSATGSLAKCGQPRGVQFHAMSDRTSFYRSHNSTSLIYRQPAYGSWQSAPRCARPRRS